MKIENNKKIIKNKLGEGEEISFSVKTSSTAYQVLSDGLYKDKIGSMIRELISNACDSQREKGNESTPIKITLPSKLSQMFIIRDFGTGLSEDNMKKVYTTYFNSTKSSDNIFKGGFGLGSKTPLCYNKEQFLVNSYYEGYKLSYMVYVDDTGVPKLKQLSKTKTNEETGLEVIIGVNENDIKQFKNKLYNFLIWNKINVDISDESSDPIEYKNLISFYDIYEGKDAFLYDTSNVKSYTFYNDLRSNGSLIILIDGIQYIINLNDIFMNDYEKDFMINLEDIIKKIKYYTEKEPDKKLLLDIFYNNRILEEIIYDNLENLGFRFKIGELDLTASRENIALTNRTKKNILTTLIGFVASCYLKLIELCSIELTEETAKEIKENSLPYYFTYSNLLPNVITSNFISDGINKLSYQISGKRNQQCWFYKGKLCSLYNGYKKEIFAPLDIYTCETFLKSFNKGITITSAYKSNGWIDTKGYFTTNELKEEKNIILSLFTSTHFSELEDILPNGHYLYIYCPTRKSLNNIKALIENAKLLKYNIYIPDSTVNIKNSYGKRKVQYRAFWYDDKLDLIMNEYEKIDYIQKWKDEGKDIYCLPVKTLTLDNLNINFLKLFYQYIPKNSLIVFVHEKKYPTFLKKYDVKCLLHNKDIFRLLRHIVQNSINLHYECDRNFFLQEDFDKSFNYYKRELEIKYELLDSYKRWKEKLTTLCKSLDKICADTQFYSIISCNFYVMCYYNKLSDPIKFDKLSYMFTMLKGEKLRKFLNLVLTKDCYLSYYDKAEFVKIINNLFEGKNV